MIRTKALETTLRWIELIGNRRTKYNKVGLNTHDKEILRTIEAFDRVAEVNIDAFYAAVDTKEPKKDKRWGLFTQLHKAITFNNWSADDFFRNVLTGITSKVDLNSKKLLEKFISSRFQRRTQLEEFKEFRTKKFIELMETMTAQEIQDTIPIETLWNEYIATKTFPKCWEWRKHPERMMQMIDTHNKVLQEIEETAETQERYEARVAVAATTAFTPLAILADERLSNFVKYTTDRNLNFYKQKRLEKVRNQMEHLQELFPDLVEMVQGKLHLKENMELIPIPEGFVVPEMYVDGNLMDTMKERLGLTATMKKPKTLQAHYQVALRAMKKQHRLDLL